MFADLKRLYRGAVDDNAGQDSGSTMKQPMPYCC